MKKIAACFFTLLFSCILNASDCFFMAGRDYRIDPDLLRAIAWNESRLNPVALGKNTDNSIDVGMMQINSQHFVKLNEMGITPEHLRNDICMNIYTGAYYLAIAFQRWGYTWRAVGAYNAGFKNDPIQEAKRLKYAGKVKAIYRKIK